jgi:DNA-binding MarR family transcriptional regulator
MTTENPINFWRDFIGIINKNLREYLKIKLRDVDLKKEEVHFLHFICKNKQVEQNELTKCFHVDKSTTTRKIRKLIDYGYIIRKKDKDDHRKYLLTPTKSGNQLSKDIILMFEELNTKLTKNLTIKETEQFQSIISKIIKNSDDLIKELK